METMSNILSSLSVRLWTPEPLIDETTFKTTQRTVNIPLNPEESQTAKGLYSCLKERLQTWQKLQPLLSANLLRVLGYSEDYNELKLKSVNVVTDEWPTVLEYIKNNKLDHKRKTELCLDLARAVLNLHNNGLAHGAIRGDNVFVRSDGVCILGLPAPFKKPSKKDLEDYRRWWSPEIQEPGKYRRLRVDHYTEYQGDYELPNDIYMLSSTFAEIFTGKTPAVPDFPNLKTTKALGVMQPIRFDDDDKVEENAIPSFYIPILEKMRVPTPQSRYTADHTVDAVMNPRLAQLHPSNHINSKSIARSVARLS